MTDKKISELASNGTLTGSELVELVQSGSNVNALLSAIKTFITTGYLTSATAASTYATIAQAKTEYLTIACSDETTELTAGTAKITFRIPYAMTLTSVRANLNTAQTSSSVFTVDINENGSSILSTKLTIDNTEKTSTTAANAPVISDGNLDDDAEITIDIDLIS